MNVDVVVHNPQSEETINRAQADEGGGEVATFFGAGSSSSEMELNFWRIIFNLKGVYTNKYMGGTATSADPLELQCLFNGNWSH